MVADTAGDDQQTDPVDGLLSGTPMHFHLWDKSEDLEYDQVDVTYRQGSGLQGTGIYNHNIQEVVESLEVKTVVTQEIPLNAGWNMVSSFVHPEDPALGVMLDSIVDNIVILKNNDGAVYWPEFGINGIGSWRIEEGYYLYMKEAMTLAVTGPEVDAANTTIPLAQGWNVISYLQDFPEPIDQSLSPIAAAVLLVKNSDGAVYWPEFGINGIGNMEPGQGYQVYTKEAVSLSYGG